MLPRRIGVARAKYLAFSGEFVSAATMCEWGLVNTVVPDAELESATDRLLSMLRKRSPLGSRRLKQLIDDGLEQPIAAGLRNELVMSDANRHSHDRREAWQRLPNGVRRCSREPDLRRQDGSPACPRFAAFRCGLWPTAHARRQLWPMFVMSNTTTGRRTQGDAGWHGTRVALV